MAAFVIGGTLWLADEKRLAFGLKRNPETDKILLSDDPVSLYHQVGKAGHIYQLSASAAAVTLYATNRQAVTIPVRRQRLRQQERRALLGSV